MTRLTDPVSIDEDDAKAFSTLFTVTMTETVSDNALDPEQTVAGKT